MRKNLKRKFDETTNKLYLQWDDNIKNLNDRELD